MGPAMTTFRGRENNSASGKESSAEIDRIAADWVAKEDRAPLSMADQAALDHWLSGDIRREGAYIRAKAVWLRMNNARALQHSDEPKPHYPRLPDLSRRQLFKAGGGAAIAAMAAGAGAFWILSPSFDTFTTGIGEIRSVPLRDGSTASISTHSGIAISLDEKRRLIRLKSGEVWFDVAKDASRPFIVESGNVQVRAIGTAFSVRKHERGSQVIVTEGIVEARANNGAPIRLSADMGAFLSNTSQTITPTQYSPSTMKRLMAWRQGIIALDGQTLAEAASEFNRFNLQQIIVHDDLLGQERVVGVFRATDPESFAKAAAATMGAYMFKSEKGLLLSRNRNPIML